MGVRSPERKEAGERQIADRRSERTIGGSKLFRSSGQKIDTRPSTFTPQKHTGDSGTSGSMCVVVESAMAEQ